MSRLTTFKSLSHCRISPRPLVSEEPNVNRSKNDVGEYRLPLNQQTTEKNIPVIRWYSWVGNTGVDVDQWNVTGVDLYISITPILEVVYVKPSYVKSDIVWQQSFRHWIIVVELPFQKSSWLFGTTGSKVQQSVKL